MPNNCTKKNKKYYHCISIIDMNNIKGIVKFKSYYNKCTINYKIKNLSNGKHGFHVHKHGDLSQGCTSGCEHFNPDNHEHGGPHSKIRHAGDLGNIISSNKESSGSITVNNLSCNPKSKYSIVGRMIIIHEDPDDLGKGDNEESKKTGNAGKRLACGIIGIC